MPTVILVIFYHAFSLYLSFTLQDITILLKIRMFHHYNFQIFFLVIILWHREIFHRIREDSSRVKPGKPGLEMYSVTTGGAYGNVSRKKSRYNDQYKVHNYNISPSRLLHGLIGKPRSRFGKKVGSYLCINSIIKRTFWTCNAFLFQE